MGIQKGKKTFKKSLNKKTNRNQKKALNPFTFLNPSLGTKNSETLLITKSTKHDLDEELLDELPSEEDENKKKLSQEINVDVDIEESPYKSGIRKKDKNSGKKEAYISEEMSNDSYARDFTEDGSIYLGEDDIINESSYRGRVNEEEMETIYTGSSQDNTGSDSFNIENRKEMSDNIQEPDHIDLELNSEPKVSSEYIERVESSVVSGDYGAAKGSVLETANYLSGQDGICCPGCAVNTIYSLRDKVIEGTYTGDFSDSSILEAVERLSPTLEQFRGMHTHHRQQLSVNKAA